MTIVVVEPELIRSALVALGPLLFGDQVLYY